MIIHPVEMASLKLSDLLRQIQQKASLTSCCTELKFEKETHKIQLYKKSSLIT